MLLIMIAYWLLALRVTVRTGVVISGTRGNYYIDAGLPFASVRLDRELDWPALYNMVKPHAGKKRRRITPRLLRLGRFESVHMSVRIGLDDAAATAVAAGTLRAALLSAAPGLGIPICADVRPDFAGTCCLIAARGIVSFCAGDIILAAAAARIRKRKEGFGWKSIPSRA